MEKNMVTTKVNYYNAQGIEYPLSDLFNEYGHKVTATIADVSDAIEDSKIGEELRENLSKLLNRTFTVDRERENYIRLKHVNENGNIKYLQIFK